MNQPTDVTDVIIRFHAPDRFAELEWTVFSVVAQGAQPPAGLTARRDGPQ